MYRSADEMILLNSKLFLTKVESNGLKGPLIG